MLMPHLDALRRDHERLAEGLLDLPDDGRGPGDVGAGRQEHAELVAAEAGDRVGLAQSTRTSRSATCRSSTSPWWWPSVSFTLLEPVEVEHHQRERLPAAGASR